MSPPVEPAGGGGGRGRRCRRGIGGRCPCPSGAVLLVLLLGPAAARANPAVGSSPSATPGPRATLRAVRLQLAGARWQAEGEVEARRGPCRWQAAALRGQGRGAIAAEQLRVTLCEGSALCPGPWLEARRLQGSGASGAWQAQGLRAAPCGCWPALRLEAPRAWLSAPDGRLQLLSPRLRWGRLPLVWLPYLSLPTRAGTSGLLWPVLGYSGRDGWRLEQGAELVARGRADARLALGWIATRGLGGRARLRYFDAVRGEGRLRLQLQQDAAPRPRWRGRLAGRVLWQGRWSAAALVPELVSDRAVLADLARSPTLVFAPYARSRAWASASSGPLVGSLVADLFQALRAPLGAGGREEGRLAARIELLPRRVLGPLQLLGQAELARSQALRAIVEDGAPATPNASSPLSPLAARGLTVWRLAPSLAAAGTWGPASWTALAGYRLQALAALEPREERLRARQAGVAALALALPLRRVFGGADRRWVHAVEAFVGGRLQHGPRYPDPAVAGLEPWAWAEGALLELGGRTDLTRIRRARALARVLRAETALQLVAGGARPHPRALTAQLAGGPLGGWRGRAEGWAALRRGGPWVLDAELCHDSGAVELCAGYWRVRGAAAEALRGWDDGAWPTVGRREPALLGGSADQVSSSARLRLGAWRVELAGWADPATRAPTHALARVATAPLCGGLELGLGADLRVGQRRPDVLAQLAWRGGGAAARCASW